MDLIIPAIASLLLTVISIPPTIIFAKKFNLVDNPRLRPHPAHTQMRIVPRAGGLAVFIGISLAILFTIPIEKHTIGILLGLLVLLVIGLLDDKYQNLSPYLRLFSQFIAASIAVGSGIGIKFITNPLGGIIPLNTLILQFNF